MEALQPAASHRCWADLHAAPTDWRLEYGSIRARDQGTARRSLIYLFIYGPETLDWQGRVGVVNEGPHDLKAASGVLRTRM
jgi:hypothetical protein